MLKMGQSINNFVPIVLKSFLKEKVQGLAGDE